MVAISKQPAGLVMFVIYEHPKDFPGHYVVRRWLGEVPDQECTLCGDLTAARHAIPRGLHCLPRFPQDDHTIVEVWL